MKKQEQELQTLAIKTLQKALSKVSFLSIEEIKEEPDDPAARPDFMLKLSLPGGEQYLVVEVKNNGQPRLAREAVNQLLRYRDLFPKAYGIFMAPYITSNAAAICARQNIGYMDLAGNCRLSFGQVYIEQEGKPNPFGEKRELRSLYSPKAERILRVLLNNPGKPWKTVELSEEAQVSVGQVSNVKKLLMDRLWIVTDKRGLTLSDPESLLQDWSKHYSLRKNTIFDYYSLKSVNELETALAELCNQNGIKYALTAFSGAIRFAPAVRYQKAMAYVEETSDRLSSMLGLKEVTSGANISLLIPYDKAVFYGTQRIGGVQIASPIQVYLDLWGIRGRGEEAARVLLEEEIRPKW